MWMSLLLRQWLLACGATAGVLFYPWLQCRKDRSSEHLECNTSVLALTFKHSKRLKECSSSPTNRMGPWSTLASTWWSREVSSSIMQGWLHCPSLFKREQCPCSQSYRHLERLVRPSVFLFQTLESLLPYIAILQVKEWIKGLRSCQRSCSTRIHWMAGYLTFQRTSLLSLIYPKRFLL